MLVIAEMVSFVLEGFHNLLSVLKDVECTDCAAGFGMKMLKLTIPSTLHHGQLLLFPLCSSLL
jgi:hypothetical protein